MNFREAYKKHREWLIHQCRKHELAEDAEAYADAEINSMSLAALMNELESIASYEEATQETQQNG